MIKNRQKIFCIGLNKTGTTSLGSFFEQNDFLVAKQKEGENLLENYLQRDFNVINKYCKKTRANVYQDVPFSLPYTFCHLDNYFKNSKFILTIRNSPEEWYDSILKFHSDFYNNGKKPDFQSLINSNYVYKGWSWDLMKDTYIENPKDMYNEVDFIKVYRDHISNVEKYFSNKPNKLITINLSIKADYFALCEFLKIKTNKESFPKITSDQLVKKNYNCDFLK